MRILPDFARSYLIMQLSHFLRDNETLVFRVESAGLLLYFYYTVLDLKCLKRILHRHLFLQFISP